MVKKEGEEHDLPLPFCYMHPLYLNFTPMLYRMKP